MSGYLGMGLSFGSLTLSTRRYYQAELTEWLANFGKGPEITVEPKKRLALILNQNTNANFFISNIIGNANLALHRI